MTRAAATAVGAAAVHVGLDAVLGAVVTGGGEAGQGAVAVPTDLVLAVVAHLAAVAVGAAGTAAVAAAVGVRLGAVLDLVEAARRLTGLGELITDQARAVAAHLTIAAVGAAWAITAAVQAGLVTVQGAVVAVLAGRAGAALTEAAAALVVAVAVAARRAAGAGAARPAVDPDLGAVLDAVVTGGGLTGGAAGPKLTDLAQAVVIGEAHAAVGASGAVGAAAVHVGLEPVLVAVVAAGSGTDAVVAADAVLTVGVADTAVTVGTGVTAAAAVHVGLVAVLDVVVAGGSVAALTEQAVTELCGAVLGPLAGGAVGAPVGAVSAAVEGQLVAV